MTATLHLLRPFARWRRHGVAIRSVDAAEAYVRDVAAEHAEFCTAVGRAPRRRAELEGGSMYFVGHGVTLFRMPYLGIEDDRVRAEWFDGRYLVLLRPELVRVRPHRIGFLRGWRYLRDADAPPDLPATSRGNGGLPDALRNELEELGL